MIELKRLIVEKQQQVLRQANNPGEFWDKLTKEMCTLEAAELRIAKLELWVEDALQFLTGDDDMCAALNHLEPAALPDFKRLVDDGEKLLGD